MKTIIKLTASSIFIVLFLSCSKYGYVMVNYPLRPMLHFPDSIKSIGLVDRCLIKKEDKKTSVIESIITGEVAGSDKMASKECLRAVYERMNGWRGIRIVNYGIHDEYGSGNSTVPDPLPWVRVRQICDSADVDALLVLEIFDSNSDVLESAVVNQVINIATNNSAPPSPQIRMTVKSFWRLYEPYSQQIIDQYQNTNFLNFNVSSVLQPPPPQALPQTAYAAGDQYISRFLPGYNRVRRDMYKRGKGSEKGKFKQAFRKSEVANWTGAIESWQKLAKSKRRVNAGRACLNIAVGHEVLGNTTEALKWAQKAYEDYNNKLARDYVGYLQWRMRYE